MRNLIAACVAPPQNAFPNKLDDDGATLRRAFNLLTEDELSLLSGFSVRTLRNWRSERKGPRFIRLGNRAFYLASDLATWLENSKETTTEWSGRELRP